eukprot:jgi/Picsp_1/3118/NSC_05959-R1_expressed protein [Chlorella variabilis]
MQIKSEFVLKRTSLVRAKAISPRLARGPVRICCHTYWSLTPKRAEKAQFFQVPSSIDLTDIIGKKRVCSIGSQDYANPSGSETIDLTVIDHGGIHVLFESESAGHKAALDSPCQLWITDVDSANDVLLNGKLLNKGQRFAVQPGSVVQLGKEDAMYIVQRNVVAHA